MGKTSNFIGFFGVKGARLKKRPLRSTPVSSKTQRIDRKIKNPSDKIHNNKRILLKSADRNNFEYPLDTTKLMKYE